MLSAILASFPWESNALDVRHVINSLDESQVRFNHRVHELEPPDICK
jgi:hypothetical protein